jgi:hypothetical protein
MKFQKWYTYNEVIVNLLSRHTPGGSGEKYGTRQLVHLVPGSSSNTSQTLTVATARSQHRGAPTIFAQCVRLYSCHNSRIAARIFMKCDTGEFSSKPALFTLYIVAYRPVARKRSRKNEETAVSMQRTALNNRSTVGSGVFYVVRSEAMTRRSEFSSVSECSAVQLSTIKWNELVSSQLEDCCSSVIVSCCC